MKILHVSDSSSVHHQEFIHCTLSNGICHRGLQIAFEQNKFVKLVHLFGFIECFYDARSHERKKRKKSPFVLVLSPIERSFILSP